MQCVRLAQRRIEMDKRRAVEFQNLQPIGVPHSLDLRLATLREAHQQLTISDAPGSLIGKPLRLVRRLSGECSVFP